MDVSVRLKIGQFEVTTDTPSEAAEMIRLFDSALSDSVSEPTLIHRPRAIRTEWDATNYEAFQSLLKEQPLQRRLLNNLFFAGYEGKSKEELVKDLELDTPKQLAGPLSGLAKNAEKIGLAREAVYTMEKVQIDGKRTYRYSLSESLNLQIKKGKPSDQKLSRADDIKDFREFIRGRRAALYGFLEQGASLQMRGDFMIITPRNSIYVRYLTENRAIVADLAKEHYGRPIKVEVGAITPSLEPQDDSAPTDDDDRFE
jgi:hypothetical protein